MSRIGYNHLQNSNWDWQYVLNHYRNLRPTTATVVNTPDKAIALLREFPDMLVIGREWLAKAWDEKKQEWVDSDHNTHLYFPDPDDWLDKFDKKYPPGIIAHTTNEPPFSDNLQNWHIDAMRKARARGRRLCVLNWNPGAPHQDEILSGKWDLILRELADGFHILGWHSYSNEDAAKVGDGLFIGENRRAADWLTARWRFMDMRSDELGIPRAKKVVTEFGVERFNSGFGNSGHSGFKDTKSPIDPDLLARALIRFDREILAQDPDVLGINYYCFYASPTWETHDISTSYSAHKLLEAYVQQTPAPAPTPAPRPAPRPTPELPPAPVYDARQEDAKLRAAVEALQARVDELEANDAAVLAARVTALEQTMHATHKAHEGALRGLAERLTVVEDHAGADVLTNALDALEHVQTGLARLRTALELLRAE